MILAIDASNIITGGGVTHLLEICNNYNSKNNYFKKVIIFGNNNVLKKIENKDYFIKRDIGIFSKNIFLRIFWLIFILPVLFKKHKCHILFSPGGLIFASSITSVTMCRNLQPFELNEHTTYGISIKTIRLYILRFLFRFSFNNSNSVIFLNNYAKNVVIRTYKVCNYTTQIIPHGVSENFTQNYKKIIPFSKTNRKKKNKIIKLIYVSTIDVYKHQWNVIEAVSNLIKENYSLKLILIGGSNSFAKKKLDKAIEKYDPKKEFVKYLGFIDYHHIHKEYQEANLGIFASSCENMPNILIEMMRSGLPIACSELGPMPEILGEGGVYFDPLDPKSIASSIKIIIENDKLKTNIVKHALLRSEKYSWSECSNKTFSFLNSVAKNSKDLYL